MQFRKSHPELTVLDAVDNLSDMAELDLSKQISKKHAGILTDEQASVRMQALSWHDPEYKAFNQERVKETFVAILKYIKHLSEKEKSSLRKAQTQRGIQAMMILAQEAAKQIDSHTEIFKGEKIKSVTELREFKELQHFYLTKIVQRFQPLSDVEEIWQERWGSGDLSGQEEGALKDLETVRKDKEYEFFLIRKEDGTPYFHRALIHHMQLVGKLDVLFADPTMEDPFLRTQMIADKEAHIAAKEILKLASSHVSEFLKDGLKFKNSPFVAAVLKAVMALMLAANSRNLMQNAVQKYVLNYYADFHFYLRSALLTSEYQKFTSGSSHQTERFSHVAVNLTHVLCTSFFTKLASHQEMIEWIHTLIEQGSEGSVTQSQTSSPLALWNNLRDKDESIRTLFKQHPNGPLLKTIQLLKKEANLQGFDPIRQQNQPAQLYVISGGDMHTTCIRLPCPTSQANIAKVSLVSEFEGFLKALKSQNSNACHLLIDLQDRTSWREHARSKAIEEAQKKSEFAGTLVVATLPKDTDFYHQAGTYMEWDDAAEFIKQLKEQVESQEQCGYYFPPDTDKKKLLNFVEKAAQTIHTLFFGKKKRLVQKNRLDFIEIFYLMLILRLIEDFKPDSLSFTCKDAVDTGAAASAEMYAFLRMMNDPAPFSKKEADFLLWMLYAPAIIHRERAIDSGRFNRMASAMAVIQAELEASGPKTIEACSKLFSFPFFKGLQVI